LTNNLRRSNEHGMEWIVKAIYVNVRFEAVYLAPVSIASNVDVDGPETPLFGRSINDCPGKQDHARTGAKGRHPELETFRNRFQQT
jgi:hypothetical protein